MDIEEKKKTMDSQEKMLMMDNGKIKQNNGLDHSKHRLIIPKPSMIYFPETLPKKLVLFTNKPTAIAYPITTAPSLKYQTKTESASIFPQGFNPNDWRSTVRRETPLISALPTIFSISECFQEYNTPSAMELPTSRATPFVRPPQVPILYTIKAFQTNHLTLPTIPMVSLQPPPSSFSQMPINPVFLQNSPHPLSVPLLNPHDSYMKNLYNPMLLHLISSGQLNSHLQQTLNRPDRHTSNSIQLLLNNPKTLGINTPNTMSLTSNRSDHQNEPLNLSMPKTVKSFTINTILGIEEEGKKKNISQKRTQSNQSGNPPKRGRPCLKAKPQIIPPSSNN